MTKKLTRASNTTDKRNKTRKRGLESSTCEIIDLEPPEDDAPPPPRKVIALWTEEDVAACKRRRAELRAIIHAYADVHRQLEDEERLQISLIQIARQLRSVTPLPSSQQPLKVLLRGKDTSDLTSIELLQSAKPMLRLEKSELP